MGRKIRAIDAETGKPISVDIDSLKQGRIQNSSLPEPLLLRIRTVHAYIRDVYDITLEQFEVGFMRDVDPEVEVAVWERIAAILNKATYKVPELDRKAAFRTVLNYSMGALTDEEQGNPDVRWIIEIAEET
ncbi:MAG: hypothetical protein QGH15_21225 [Kiritimatiellia bacterium]|jgi:hypothetical protein|nr:hypothetical protein [Kiritimatiellia bacterium]